jgi:ribosome biogenesis GTPase
VGKSTLVNATLGQPRQAVRDTRSSGYGRHTTTAGQLVELTWGGWLIDTPGVRELGLGDGAADAVDEAFPDIAQLAARCRFGDCAHHTEPGCAVMAAVALEELDAGRLAAWRKLGREAARSERLADERLARAHDRTMRSLYGRHVREQRLNPKRQGRR